MLRISVFVATVLAVVASSAQATPISTDAGLGGKGYLYVLGRNSNNSPYNETASIPDHHLKIAPPKQVWELTVISNTTRGTNSYTPAVVLIRTEDNLCLTAHEPSGPSYLSLLECADKSSRTGQSLQYLKDRQYWQAIPGGDTVGLIQSGGGQYPLRDSIHVEKDKDVHLATEPGPHNYQLYFQAFQ